MAFMQALVAVAETGEEGDGNREGYRREQWNGGTYLSIEVP